MSIHLPSPRSRRAALALLAASAVLTACGGGDSASSATAGGSALVVKGSMSSTARAAASTPWWQRAIAWIAPRAAQAQVATAGSPVSMVLTLHSLQISANADCTGPYVTVQTFSPAREVDLASNPTLFEGSPPAGAYRCLIFEA
ncbi:MAG: hypothetical protein N2688_06550, partial [Burkholderiaceae bacterium]|nr:hypothetical protein [Burkholderiaceae bacterium]